MAGLQRLFHGCRSLKNQAEWKNDRCGFANSLAKSRRMAGDRNQDVVNSWWCV